MSMQATVIQQFKSDDTIVYRMVGKTDGQNVPTHFIEVKSLDAMGVESWQPVYKSDSRWESINADLLSSFVVSVAKDKGQY